jgi:hypothetical protein
MGIDTVGIFLFLVGVVLVQAFGQRRRSSEALALTAGRLGLEGDGEDRVRGRARGFGVELEAAARGRRRWLEIRLAGLPEGFEVSSGDEEWLDPVLIGEPGFDGALSAAGDEAVARARLDAPARAALLAARAAVDELRLERGVLVARLEDEYGLDRAVSALLEAAARLAGGEDRERLARSAFEDPAPRVRELSLQVLLETSLGAAWETAVQCALRHEAPELRLLGARAVAERDRGPLVALALDEGLAPALRLEAISALPRSTPGPTCAQVALAALASEQPALRAAGARLAGRLEPGDEAVEAALIRAVGAGGGQEARLAAVAALRRVGSPRAVAALQPLTRGVLAQPAMKRRARDAVRSIQGRADRRAAGALTLVAPPGEREGAVSVTDHAARGAVSIQGRER